MPEIGSSLRVFAYDQITVAASSTRLTLANVRGAASGSASPQPWAEKVIITVETAQIRWRDDGTDPTSSVGHLANVGTIITLDNRNRIDRFRAIRTGSTSALLNVSYLG